MSVHTAAFGCKALSAAEPAEWISCQTIEETKTSHNTWLVIYKKHASFECFSAHCRLLMSTYDSSDSVELSQRSAGQVSPTDCGSPRNTHGTKLRGLGMFLDKT